MAEDPDRLIVDYMDHIPVPKLQKYMISCSQCQERLTKSSINCRICGNLFCNLCIAKYHVMPKFQHLDSHKGTSNVCFSCRDSCRLRRLLQDRRFTSEAVIEDIQPLRSGYNQSINHRGIVKVNPPVQKWNYRWLKIKICHLCNKETSQKLRNCRVCGDLYCVDCSVKLPVPEAFRIKGKNPARVCKDCRFYLLGKNAIILDDNAATKSSGSVELENKIVRNLESSNQKDMSSPVNNLKKKVSQNENIQDEVRNNFRSNFKFSSKEDDEVSSESSKQTPSYLSKKNRFLVSSSTSMFSTQSNICEEDELSGVPEEFDSNLSGLSSPTLGNSLKNSHPQADDKFFLLSIKLDRSSEVLWELNCPIDFSLADVQSMIYKKIREYRSEPYSFLYHNVSIPQPHLEIYGAKHFQSEGLYIRFGPPPRSR